jgi:hypothetical protein
MGRSRHVCSGNGHRFFWESGTISFGSFYGSFCLIMAAVNCRDTGMSFSMQIMKLEVVWDHPAAIVGLGSLD